MRFTVNYQYRTPNTGMKLVKYGCQDISEALHVKKEIMRFWLKGETIEIIDDIKKITLMFNEKMGN